MHLSSASPLLQRCTQQQGALEDMLTVTPKCTFEVSEQAARQHAVCAKCNMQFSAGDLRLRPSGTRNTRLIHPHCSHGFVTSSDDISNLDSLPPATRQRLERALSFASSSHGAAGDVPHPDLSDPQQAEIAPNGVTKNSLKHLEILDQFSGIALLTALL